jgi:voltage-gated potassium channel Kch
MLWTSLSIVLAFVLGYTGYRLSLPADLGRLDAVYRTMQLYAMDSEVQAGAPWQLNVARFVAPLSLATAAVVAAVVFFRDNVHRLMIGFLARDHVVVIGLSSSTGAVAEDMIALGQRVVVIEADRQNSQLPGLRALGALVLIGDGRQSVILHRARVRRARHIVVNTGDDTNNLAIADRVYAVRAEHDRRMAVVHVAVADPDLWLEVGRLSLTAKGSGTWVECFNVHDRAAQRLVDVAEAIGGMDSVAVIGTQARAERVKAHLLRRAALYDRSIEITAAPTPHTRTILVCGHSLGIAEAIASAREQPDAHVVVAIDAEGIEPLKGLLGSLSERLHIVPVTSASLAKGLLEDSAIEVMAQAKHDDYLEMERAKGLTAVDNPSLVSWEELPESLRDSNRRFAASVAQLLDSLGASLEPLRDESGQALELRKEDLEALAIREHDRWEADLRKDGWVYASGPKDPLAKTHPLLIPWERLSEEEREKDRDAIRALPRMLARAGYRLSA